jgi:hypothetical protein
MRSDALIDGGAGNDTACYDRLADPAPVAVETASRASFTAS